MAPEPPAQHQPDRPLTLRQAIPSTALAVLLSAVVILTLLGHNRLTDWDEGIYAQVSRQILTTQHFNPSSWLVLHWNTGLWLEKPPLTFWITAVFYKLFGVSEFTARLGSALSAIALVKLLHYWLLRTRGLLTAWLSTFILLSTFGFLHIARVGETDTLLSFGCLLALIGLTNLLLQSDGISRQVQASQVPSASEDPKASRYPKASALGFFPRQKTGALAPGGMLSLNGWYLYWTGFAIALMSKGAASGGLFLTLVLLLLIDPVLRQRVRAPFFYGLLIFLVLVLPWHLYLLHRFGNFFVDEYLNLHVIGRVTHQYDGHITHWWYYLRVLLFSAPPWVLLYPIALCAAFRRHPDPRAQRRAKDPRISQVEPTMPGAPSSATASSSPKVGSQSLRPLALFALIQIIAFSFVQTRLPHYVAPAYAPLSALVAIWLAAWFQKKSLILQREREDAPLLREPKDAVILSGARNAQSKDPDAAHPAPTPSALSAHTLFRFRLQFATGLAAVWILTALLTAHPRSQLHSPRLPNGVVTPNNREVTALLKQVFQHPSPLVASASGPLLDGRPGTYNPIPTVVFYANRPVQQVELQPSAPDTPSNATSPANPTIDIYTYDPIPLAEAVTTQPRLLLIARALIPQIPANYVFQPIDSSPTLELGLISRLP